jgi:hypothetical protein
MMMSTMGMYREALCFTIRLGYLAGVPVRELGARRGVTSGWPLYASVDAHHMPRRSGERRPEIDPDARQRLIDQHMRDFHGMDQ